MHSIMALGNVNPFHIRVDVDDAQRTLFSVEEELVQSDRSVIINLIAVYKALGGGWER